MTNSPTIPVSWGELIDKITILEIKARKATDPLVKARVEGALVPLIDARGVVPSALGGAAKDLARINERLFYFEDRIRELIDNEDFGPVFVFTSVGIREYNDLRATIKRFIDDVTDSGVTEEKIYSPRGKRNATT
ncbi:MAG: hypothetical protein KGL39_07745 [Patescibacteria group bacterium]|nr:hypothetical protein [Patescibacteria group bacterium]